MIVAAVFWLVIGVLVLWSRRGRRRDERRPEQTTFCYCPNCKHELCGGTPASTCSDTDLVRFTCGACGHYSSWDFDAPVPLLVVETRWSA